MTHDGNDVLYEVSDSTAIVTLNRLAGEPVDLLVNGKPIARGEVVVIHEEFGLRVTEMLAPKGADAPDAAGDEA